MATCVAPPTFQVLAPSQKVSVVRRDHCTKKDLAYLVLDRVSLQIFMGQSLPVLCAAINAQLNNSERWNRVSVTGLFENMNREPQGSRNGSWHKGRYRVRSVALHEAKDVFESYRQEMKTAIVVAVNSGAYETISV